MNQPAPEASGSTNQQESEETADNLGSEEQVASTGQRRRWLEYGLMLVVFAGFFSAWVLASRNASPIIFPSPGRVWNEFYIIAFDKATLWSNLWVTLKEIVFGFVLGSLIGIGLGVMLAHSTLLRRIVNPYLLATQAVPKLALAPMLVLWFGFGIASKVVIAALIAFFPLLENTVVGLQEVPAEEIHLFRSLRATRWQIFVKLRFPSALPYIFAGLRVAMLFATVGAVIGEFVGANVGLGAMLIVAFGTLNTALMFAVLFVLTALGVLLYSAVDYAGRYFQRAYQGSKR